MFCHSDTYNEALCAALKIKHLVLQVCKITTVDTTLISVFNPLTPKGDRDRISPNNTKQKCNGNKERQYAKKEIIIDPIPNYSIIIPKELYGKQQLRRITNEI